MQRKDPDTSPTLKIYTPIHYSYTVYILTSVKGPCRAASGDPSLSPTGRPGTGRTRLIARSPIV